MISKIAIPQRQITLPRFEFPNFLKRIPDPLRMFRSPMGDGVFVQPMGGAGTIFSPSGYGTVVEWIKADAITGLIDNDPVSTWTAQIGNDATGTGTARPLYKTNIKNGLPAVRFDGINDYLTTPIALTGTTLTSFVVAKHVAKGDNKGALSIIASGAANDYDNASSVLLFYFQNSANLMSYRTLAKSTTTNPANGTFFIFTSRFNGTNNVVYLNTTAATAVASTGSFNTVTAYIGCRVEASVLNHFSNIDLMEILLYSTAVSDTDILTILAYLNNKWAIY